MMLPAERFEAPVSRAAMHLDIGIGFTVFWGFVLLVTVVYQELTGGAALVWALLLAGVVLAMVSLFRLRYRLQRRDQELGAE
ncbi:hypothetical protein [Psychromicrobium xiongbiense]|uniref:hypothetical protein n=1 Tax=Psychromicrobium xiongbiense TaxID=3051184 RepID=UPI0025554BDC|nr:hypothetical protein [Psychromicrobium sp. YIM S02556]